MNPDHQAACLAALGEAVGEVAATVLGGLSVDALGQGRTPTSGHGAYLGLIVQDEPIQVAFLADGPGCQLLSKTLLGMDPADEDLSTSDVSDAMCEVINIVAGCLKRRVSGTLSVTLGLPIFVAGPPLPNQQQDLQSRAFRLGEVPVEALLLTQKQRTEAASKSSVSQVASKDSTKEQSA